MRVRILVRDYVRARVCAPVLVHVTCVRVRSRVCMRVRMLVRNLLVQAVSGRLGWNPAFLGLCTPCTLRARRAVYQPRAPQPVSLSQLRSAEPVCLQIAPRSACVLTRRSTVPQGTRRGNCHPAAADAAASALRALRRAATATGTRRGVPPALRVLPDVSDVPCLSAAHTVAASRSAVCRPCRALPSLLWRMSESHVSRGRACRVSRHAVGLDSRPGYWAGWAGTQRSSAPGRPGLPRYTLYTVTARAV